MNVYFGSSSTAWSVSRIVSALDAHLPFGMTRVHRIGDADLVVLHVTGRNEHITREAVQLKLDGHEYAVIQYALKSTRNPDPADWKKLWDGAKCVWSYYDLKDANIPNFYHAPLGPGSNLFYPQNEEKKYLVGTTGNCYQAECIGEVHMAAWSAGGRAVHIGEQFQDNPIVDYLTGISDDSLRAVINSCQYFSCLRRKEGFEMPAVEALLCGVRPIMFDTLNYRQWFDKLALFVPEDGIAETAERVRRILKQVPTMVTADEIAETKRRFNWQTSVSGFWARCL